MKRFFIAPSILSANFAYLGLDVQKVIDAGADFIHFDIMDNHYVPNLTFGPMICKSLRQYGIKVPFDIHLMVTSVESLIPKFIKAGATSIIFHVEACKHIDYTLQLIRDYGCKAGIAINPATSLNCLEYIINKLDIILIMSVNPGFGGQTFILESVKKVHNLYKLISNQNNNIDIMVDGGIKLNNIIHFANAGANIFVMGSEIFCQKNYNLLIKNIRIQLSKILK